MLQEEYQVHLQPTRTQRVKLEWLNWQEYAVDELQGFLLSGNITIARNQAVRRTCNITMYTNDDRFVPNQEGYIWLNRKFRLWIGIDSILTGKTVWFDKGIYILNKPSLNYSQSDKTISLVGLDKMCLYDGTLNGKLLNPINIPVGTDINVALKTTLQSLGGETKFNMDFINKPLPYTIEKDSGASIYDALKEIAELYMDWSEIYFDEQGFFRFEKNKERTNDALAWDFTENNLVINYKNDPDFENIKNHIQIWGKLKDDGTQIKYTLQNNDINNPYSIGKIGQRNLPVKDDKIYTTEQAQIRAEWELLNHSDLNEIINVSVVPIFTLDVNKVVYFNNKETGIQGRYLIDSINFGLGHDGSMSISAYKLQRQ